MAADRGAGFPIQGGRFAPAQRSAGVLQPQQPAPLGCEQFRAVRKGLGSTQWKGRQARRRQALAGWLADGAINASGQPAAQGQPAARPRPLSA